MADVATDIQNGVSNYLSLGSNNKTTQNVGAWQQAYYDRYKSEAASLGLPIVSQAEFNSKVGNSANPNFEQEYSAFIDNQQQKVVADLSTAKTNLGVSVANYIKNGDTKAANAAIDAFAKLYPNEDLTPYKSALPSATADPTTTLKTNLTNALANGTIDKATYDQATKLIESGLTDQAQKYFSNAATANTQILPSAPTLDNSVPAYTPTVEDPTAPIYNYTPSDLMNTIQAKLTEVMNNPQSISPESVQKWADWYKQTNAASDRIADTRTNEQFSALGDLGSSQNRNSLALASVERNLGYSNAGVGLAQQDLANKYSQTMGGISGLMQVENTNLGQQNITINQQWQDYLAKLGQTQNINSQGYNSQLNTKAAQNNASIQDWLNKVGAVQGDYTAARNQAYGLQNAAVQNSYTGMNALLGNNIQTANTANANIYNSNQQQQLLNYYQNNQPSQQQWWQPLVNAGLSTAGQIGTTALLSAL